MTDIRTLLQQKLRELPEQIHLIQEQYNHIADPNEKQVKVMDLVSYEKRMREGLEYLLVLPDETIACIERIRNPSDDLLTSNTDRYLAALQKQRDADNRRVSHEEIVDLQNTLSILPFVHASEAVDELRKKGITPASALWMTPVKTCANPMDIALGLDEYVFLVHGFCLSNFSEKVVRIQSSIINRPGTLVSTVDIFKLALIHTQKTMPCAISTKEWVPVLETYEKQLFRGRDFWRLKAEYTLTYFENADTYHQFASQHFYENFIENAPEGEMPFLGELKMRGHVDTSQFL